MKLIYLGALALVLGAGAHAADAPQTVRPAAASLVSDTHEQLVRRMLLAADIHGIFHSVLGVIKNNPQAEIGLALIDTIPPARLADALVPVFVPAYTAQQASDALQLLELPLYRKVLSAFIVAGAAGAKPDVSSADGAEFLRLRKERPAQAAEADRLFSQLMQGESKRLIMTLAQQQTVEIMSKWLLGIREHIRAIQGASSEAALDQLPAPKTGMAWTDQTSRIISDTQKRMQRADMVFSRATDAPEYRDVLAPEKLVSPAGIANARRGLSIWDTQSERLISETMGAVKDREAGIKAIPLLATLKTDVITRQIEGLYAYVLRLSETMRALGNVQQRYVDFMESRLGQTEFSGGRLVFTQQGDATIANELAASMAAAVADLHALNQEQEDKLNRLEAEIPALIQRSEKR